MPHKSPRTKLIATLGPASAERETLAAMFDAGVDVCRINFSHGSPEQHECLLASVRELAKERDMPIAVVGDLCGPKIRLNRVAGGSAELLVGAPLRITRGDDDCTPERLTTTLPDLIDDVGVGHRVYIDDGLVRLLVTDQSADALTCSVTVGGTISTRKGVNLPDSGLSVPALTDTDRRDLVWAIEHELDFVALSFVRRPADLYELKDLIREHGGDVGVIVKIEKVEALEHLDDLIAASDAVLVARGDLGVELDIWQVPMIQKAITARCREVGVPVIIATQMLQSMVHSPMPTRAEVSDVANAIIDAADAVMLSAETAVGDYPVATVDMMTKTSQVAEAYLVQGPHAATRYIAQRSHTAAPDEVHGVRGLSIPDAAAARSAVSPNISATHPRASAIAHAAVQAARDVNARLVAVWSATGRTARLVAKHRLPVPVVGLSYNERVCRQMNLLYGVIPILVKPIANPAEMADVLDVTLIRRGLAKPGDLIVVVTSTQPETPGATDTTLVHRVGEPGQPRDVSP